MNEIASKFENMMFIISRYIHKSDPIHNIGLSFSQVMLLSIIEKMGNPKMKDLSKELGVTLSNVTGLVDRLFISGYVKRANDINDRRIVRIVLTKKGENIVGKIIAQKHNCIKKIFSKLSLNDRNTIINIMQKLVDEIKKEGD